MISWAMLLVRPFAASWEKLKTSKTATCATVPTRLGPSKASAVV